MDSSSVEAWAWLQCYADVGWVCGLVLVGLLGWAALGWASVTDCACLLGLAEFDWASLVGCRRLFCTSGQS